MPAAAPQVAPPAAPATDVPRHVADLSDVQRCADSKKDDLMDRTDASIRSWIAFRFSFYMALITRCNAWSQLNTLNPFTEGAPCVAPKASRDSTLAPQRPRRTRAASLHVRLRRPSPGLRAGRRLLRAHGGHLLLQCHDANAPFLWSSPGRIIAPSSRAVAFCGSYPRRVWAPFYSAGGSGGVRARSPAAILHV